MTTILDFKFENIFVEFDLIRLTSQCHSLWPVSELSHLRPRVKRGRSPEKTGRSWALPAAGRGPAARGMCPLMMKDNRILGPISLCEHWHPFSKYSTVCYSRLWGV